MKRRSLDVLINNAGVTHRHTAETATDDEWDHVMAVNVTIAASASVRSSAVSILDQCFVDQVLQTCVVTLA
jgi:NAD(P)-dependent dehydrogenase (short-subunit alcohol dehydrogenase family)